jgi:hypothetical protein
MNHLGNKVSRLSRNGNPVPSDRRPRHDGTLAAPPVWGEAWSMDGKNETAPHDESQEKRQLMAELTEIYKLSPESQRIVSETFHLPLPPTGEQDKPAPKK